MRPPRPPPKATKELGFGARVGRALQKLTDLNESEADELANAPQSIRERYAKKRDALLGELEPAIKSAVLGAAVAVAPKSEAAE